MKYLQNEAEAKDSVQEIVLQVLSNLKRHKISYFKSWLFSVTRNHCLVKLRKNKNFLFTEDLPELASEENAQLILEKENMLLDLENSLEELAEEQRRCICLFYFENKSYKEIETITGYASKKVKSYIQNGKRNLKLSLDKKQLKQNG